MPDQSAYGKEFFKKFYKPEYVSLVIVGDVDPQATMKMVKKHWGNWQKGNYVADIPVEDDLFEAIPLGNKNEALLKAAIEDITGSEVLALKSAKVVRPYQIFDRGFSKFDANKRELIYNQMDKSILMK